MTSITDFIQYTVPWWLWLFPSLGLVGAIFFVLVRTLGVRNALQIAGMIALCAAFVANYRRGKQDGWAERIQRENDNAKRITDKARRIRERVESAAPERLRDDDGFRRD
ncbi:hypothetical protein WKW50_16420 [Ochrobactrum sp. GPK 3]